MLSALKIEWYPVIDAQELKIRYLQTSVFEQDQSLVDLAHGKSSRRLSKLPILFLS